VASGGRVYWIDAAGDLRDAPAAGGSSSLVAQGVHALTADEQFFYWSQLEAVFQAPHDGSPAGPIAFEAGTALATHFGDIYWLVPAGAIRKRSADPGPIGTVVAALSSMPSTFAVDGSGIYALLPSEGLVARFRHQDGAMEPLASGQPSARSLAVDDQHIYWLTDNALLRVAK
jgi:hypothetical protein